MHSLQCVIAPTAWAANTWKDTLKNIENTHLFSGRKKNQFVFRGKERNRNQRKQLEVQIEWKLSHPPVCGVGKDPQSWARFIDNSSSLRNSLELSLEATFPCIKMQILGPILTVQYTGKPWCLPGYHLVHHHRSHYVGLWSSPIGVKPGGASCHPQHSTDQLPTEVCWWWAQIRVGNGMNWGEAGADQGWDRIIYPCPDSDHAEELV